MSFLECENEECRGKCKLPAWARAGTSNYANDIAGQQAYLARCHSWFKPAWMAGVIAYQRAKATAPRASTFPCSCSTTVVYPCTSCGRFAFPEPTTCHWCRQHPITPRALSTDSVQPPAPVQGLVNKTEPSARPKRRHVDKSPPPEPGLFGDP